MTIWIFGRFGLKCLFTPPKFWFLGVLTHKRDWSSSRPPKGTSLAGTALTWRFWWRSVKRCDLGACWRNQKKRKKGKERNLQWQTGCSPRPPTLTQRYVVLRAGWSSGGSSKFQVSSKSFEQFSRCAGRNLPFPILKASGLYNSLYYRTSREVPMIRLRADLRRVLNLFNNYNCLDHC